MGDLDRQLDSLSLMDTNELTESNRQLRSKLEAVRKRRRQTNALQQRQETLQSALTDHINEARHTQQYALQDFQSIIKRKQTAVSTLELSCQFNVLNDCFHIWHQGPFATINGHRLGAEAPALQASDPAKTASTTPGLDPPPRRLLAFASPTPVPDASKAAGASNSNGNGNDLPPTTFIRVPWTEINAALGYTALLMATLEGQPHCGIHYRYEIVTSGSTSRIGLRRSDNTAPTLYNLFSDDSFSFFGKRHFNLALQYLLECVGDAATAIQKRDRTIALPHAIEHFNGEWTVGGLSVGYTVNGVEWTRAMKYLLTNVKHLLIYRSFGLWSNNSST